MCPKIALFSISHVMGIQRMFFQPTSGNYVCPDFNRIAHFLIIHIRMLWLVVVW
jgi:hypothetical protein